MLNRIIAIALSFLLATQEVYAGGSQPSTPANLSRLKTALAATAAGQSNTRICTNGDSTTFGAGSLGSASVFSGNLIPGSYPSQLANALSSMYGYKASWQGFLGGSVTGTTAYFGALDSRIVQGSSWTRDFTNTSFGVASYKATTGTNAFSFTPTVPVDTFRFGYLTIPGNGTLSVDIDGGTATTYNTNAANGIVFATLTAGSVSTHTINFKWSAGSQVNIQGVSEAYDSTYKWVNVVNMGASTALASDVGNSSAGFGTTTSSAWASLGCDAVIWSNAINDWNASTSIGTYTTNITNLLSAAASSGASIIVWTPDPTGGAVTSTTQQTYIAAIKSVVLAGGYALVDLYNRWGTYAASNALLYNADVLHPNYAGYTDISQFILENILPPSGGHPLTYAANAGGNFFSDQTITAPDNAGLTLVGTSTFGAGLKMNATAGGGQTFFLNSTGSANAKAGWLNFNGAQYNVNLMALYGGSSASAGQMMQFGSALCMAFSSTNNALGTADLGICRDAAGMLDFGNGTPGDTSGRIKAAGLISAGTKFTTSGCSVSASTGGATAGTLTLGANSCTVIITPGFTAPTGFSCDAHDRTAPTILIGGESSSTTTTASIPIPAGAGATDVISFKCMAY